MSRLHRVGDGLSCQLRSHKASTSDSHPKMAMPMLRHLLMPSIRLAPLPAVGATLRPSFVKPAPTTPVRNFSSTTPQNATLNQVLRVMPPLLSPHASIIQKILTYALGLSAKAPRTPRHLAGSRRRPRPAAQRSLRQSRHHEAQEAQLGRTEDGTCALDVREDHHGVHSWRGAQHSAAQCGVGEGRACTGLPWCAVQIGTRSFGSGRCHEPDECEE